MVNADDQKRLGLGAVLGDDEQLLLCLNSELASVSSAIGSREILVENHSVRL